MIWTTSFILTSHVISFTHYLLTIDCCEHSNKPVTCSSKNTVGWRVESASQQVSETACRLVWAWKQLTKQLEVSQRGSDRARQKAREPARGWGQHIEWVLGSESWRPKLRALRRRCCAAWSWCKSDVMCRVSDLLYLCLFWLFACLVIPLCATVTRRKPGWRFTAGFKLTVYQSSWVLLR